MPETAPGIEGKDWVRVVVLCPACKKELVLKVVPDAKDQHWACPYCHARHVGGPADGQGT